MPPKKEKPKSKAKIKLMQKKADALKLKKDATLASKEQWLSWNEHRLLDMKFLCEMYSHFAGESEVAPQIDLGDWFTDAINDPALAPFVSFVQMRLQLLNKRFIERFRPGLSTAEEDLILEAAALASPTKDAKASTEETPAIPVSMALPKSAETVLQGMLTFLEDVCGQQPDLCLRPLRLMSETVAQFAPQMLCSDNSILLTGLGEMFSKLIQVFSGDSEVAATVDRPQDFVAVCIAGLIALAVARGTTDSVLEVVDSLLTVGDLSVPVLSSLQGLFDAIRGAPKFPVVTPKPECESTAVVLPIPEEKAAECRPSVASDGVYLYVHSAAGLQMIGTGHGGTESGKVYCDIPDLCVGESSWVGVLRDGRVLFRAESTAPGVLRVFDSTDALLELPSLKQEEGEAFGQSPVHMFVKGNKIVVASASSADTITVTTFSIEETTLTEDSSKTLTVAPSANDLSCTVIGASEYGKEDVLKVLAAPDSLTEEQRATGIRLPCEFRMLSCSEDTIVAVDANGFCWFQGSGTPLGLPGKVAPEFEIYPLLQGVKVRLAAVGPGAKHALFVTEENLLFAVGSGENGELGDGKGADSTRLVLIKLPTEEKLVNVAVGVHKSGCITEGGLLYTWGQDSGGNDLGWLHQLHGKHASPRKKSPYKVNELDDAVKIVFGGLHTLVLTSAGKVYSFGDSTAGQCGQGTSEPQTAPGAIAGLEDVVDIAAGQSHSVAILKSGECVTWGRGVEGQLGHGDGANRVKPTVLDFLKGRTIVGASCGAHHTVFCMENGDALSCGRGDEGQLGRIVVAAGDEGLGDAKIAGCLPGKMDFDRPVKSTLCCPYSTLVFPRPLPLGENGDLWKDCAVFPGISNDLLVLLTPGSPHCVERVFVTSSEQPEFAFEMDAPFTRCCADEKELKMVDSIKAISGTSSVPSLSYDPVNRCVWAMSDSGKAAVSFSVEMGGLSGRFSAASLLCRPPFSASGGPGTTVNSQVVGVSLLATLDAAGTALEKGTPVLGGSQGSASNSSSPGKPDSKSLITEEFSVERYERKQRGWGCSAGSADGLMFEVDEDVELLGAGIYGSTESVNGTVYITEDVRGEGEKLAEGSFEIESGEEMERADFDSPLLLTAGTKYCWVVKKSGNNFMYGESGKQSITVEDITFKFSNASLPRNNGTNSGRGQCPVLYFRRPLVLGEMGAHDLPGVSMSTPELFTVPFAKSMTADGAAHLLSVLRWITKRLEDLEDPKGDGIEGIDEITLQSVLLTSRITKRVLGLLDGQKIEPFRFATLLWDFQKSIWELLGRLQVLSNSLSRSHDHYELLDAALTAVHEMAVSAFPITFPTDLLRRLAIRKALSGVAAAPMEALTGPTGRYLAVVLEGLSSVKVSKVLTGSKDLAISEGSVEAALWDLYNGDAVMSGTSVELDAGVTETKVAEGVSAPSTGDVEGEATDGDDLQRLLTLVTSTVETTASSVSSSPPLYSSAASKLLSKLQQEIVLDLRPRAGLMTAAKPTPVYRNVVRFAGANANSWGHGGTPDIISFKVDAPVMIGGVLCYGSEGEYKAKIEIREGQSETSPLLASADGEYESHDTEPNEVLFDEGVQIEADQYYFISATIDSMGKNSCCGNGGKQSVDTDEGVIFTWFAAQGRNNGSSVSSGQVPGLVWAPLPASTPSLAPFLAGPVVTSGTTEEWTFNDQDCGEGAEITEEGMKFTHGGNGGTTAVRGTVAFTSGCHAWEVNLETHGGSHTVIGVCTASVSLRNSNYLNLIGDDENAWGYKNSGEMLHKGNCGSGASYENGATIRCTLDCDAKTFTVEKDGEEINTFSDVYSAEGLYPVVSTTYSRGILKLVSIETIRPSRGAVFAVTDPSSGLSEDQWKPFLTFALTMVRTANSAVGTLQDMIDDGKSKELFQQVLASSTILTEMLPLLMAHTLRAVSCCPPEVPEGLLGPLANLTLRLNDLSKQEPNVGTAISQQVVETLHPYQPATKKKWVVRFPKDVSWVVLHFDERCATGQEEDYLLLYSDEESTKQVYQRFGGNPVGFKEDGEEKKKKKITKQSPWPQHPLVIPGNVVVVEFHSATLYDRVDPERHWGSKVTVTGHCVSSVTASPLKRLTSEASFTTACCAAELMQGDQDTSVSPEIAKAMECALVKHGFEEEATPSPRSSSDEGDHPLPEAVVSPKSGKQLWKNVKRAVHVASAFSKAGGKTAMHRAFLDSLAGVEGSEEDKEMTSACSQLMDWLLREELSAARTQAKKDAIALKKAERAKIKAKKQEAEAEKQGIREEYQLKRAKYVEQITMLQSMFEDAHWGSCIKALETTMWENQVDVNRAADWLLMNMAAEVDRIESISHELDDAPPPTPELVRAISEHALHPWSCDKCTFENPGEKSKCEICGSERPEGGLKLDVKSEPAVEWNCAACTLVNPGSLAACQACGSPKPAEEEKKPEETTTTTATTTAVAAPPIEKKEEEVVEEEEEEEIEVADEDIEAAIPTSHSAEGIAALRATFAASLWHLGAAGPALDAVRSLQAGDMEHPLLQKLAALWARLSMKIQPQLSSEAELEKYEQAKALAEVAQKKRMDAMAGKPVDSASENTWKFQKKMTLSRSDLEAKSNGGDCWVLAKPWMARDFEGQILYFEVEIVDTSGPDNKNMVIGFQNSKPSGQGSVPWSKSCGMCGNGSVLPKQKKKGEGHKLSRSFGEGDIAGVGWNVEKQTVFYTINGMKQGEDLPIPGKTPRQLYPCVSCKKGGQVIVNFGKEPFLYKQAEAARVLRSAGGDDDAAILLACGEPPLAPSNLKTRAEMLLKLKPFHKSLLPLEKPLLSRKQSSEDYVPMEALEPPSLQRQTTSLDASSSQLTRPPPMLEDAPNSPCVLEIIDFVKSSVDPKEIMDAIVLRKSRALRRIAGLRTLRQLIAELRANGGGLEVYWVTAAVLHSPIFTPDHKKNSNLGDALHKAKTDESEQGALFLRGVGGADERMRSEICTAAYDLLEEIADGLRDSAKAKDGAVSTDWVLCNLHALRCWELAFGEGDHQFLHGCSIFPALRALMSPIGSDEGVMESKTSDPRPPILVAPPLSCSVGLPRDISDSAKVSASSGEDRLKHLVDNSTETFWQANWDGKGEKFIKFELEKVESIYEVDIYIDYTRDKNADHKVSHVSMLLGADDGSLTETAEWNVKSKDKKLFGWHRLPGHGLEAKVIRLNLKAGRNCRIRGIRVMASPKVQSYSDNDSALIKKVEMESLRVFRTLSARVFAGLVEEAVENKDEAPAVDGSGIPLAPPPMARQVSRQRSSALREHVACMLFDERGGRTGGVVFSELQRQLFDLISAEIVREGECIREAVTSRQELLARVAKGEGDPMDVHEVEDEYFFELLCMLVSLSNSEKGLRRLVSSDILPALVKMLPCGIARVQRQLILLLRRILPVVTPESLDDALRLSGVKLVALDDDEEEELPYGGDMMAAMRASDRDAIRVLMQRQNKTAPSEAKAYSRAGEGIVPFLLLVLAKAIRMRIRGRKMGKTVTCNELLPPLKELMPHLAGVVEEDIAGDMLGLLQLLHRQDPVKVEGGEAKEEVHPWKKAINGVCRTVIVNLPSVLEALQQDPELCLSSPSVWLSLSALSVVGELHSEVLGDSSVKKVTTVDKPVYCTNHDDGRTEASYHCNDCGEGESDLCMECDMIFHLNRKRRGHRRDPIKRKEDEALKIDYHDDCVRIRLPWLLVIIDVASRQAIIEFKRDTAMRLASLGGGGEESACRFCGDVLTAENMVMGGEGAPAGICSKEECQELGSMICKHSLECGHSCGGVNGESVHLQCLHGCCDDGKGLDGEDYCRICWQSALQTAPCIRLGCGHVFHHHCVKKLIENRWNGPRISFGFLQCPLCRTAIEHETLEEVMKPVQKLKEEVERKAVMRARYEGLNNHPDVVNEGGKYYDDLVGFASHHYAYYQCHECKHAYYGGQGACAAAGGDVKFDPKELICPSCQPSSPDSDCPKHGTEYVEWKCRFCCSIAVYFCFGTTHFCEKCHSQPGRMSGLTTEKLPICPAGPLEEQLEGDCPLGVPHPPTGEEHCLGCSLCSNEKTF